MTKTLTTLTLLLTVLVASDVVRPVELTIARPASSSIIG